MKSYFVTKNDPFRQTLISFHYTQDFLTKRQSLGWIIKLQFLYQTAICMGITANVSLEFSSPWAPVPVTLDWL
jgi:hypothetical protein